MEWQPHPRQAEVLSRRERELLYGGARGGGKTACGMAWLAEPEYISNPRFRGLVIRKSFKDLADWIAKARIFFAGTAQLFTVPAEIRFPSGAIIALGHWGDPSAVSMYLGQEYQKILIEELTDVFSNEEDYMKLLGSLRSSDPTLVPQVLNTTNPGGPGHVWVKLRFVDCALNHTYYDPKTGATRIFIPSKVSDNPSITENDPNYVLYLDSLPERLRRAWRDGSWDLAEGSFFQEFNKDLMLEPMFQIDETSSHQRLFGSMDIGASHHTSFGLWYVSPDGQIHRMMTYCRKMSSIRDHAKEIYDAIASHRPTKGYFPKTVWVGRDAWTKSKISETFWRSPIDEFEDKWNVQGKQGVVFEQANDFRANGCMIMQDLFKPRSGKPQVSYIEQYNQQYEEAIPSVMINKDKPEEYLKTNNWADDLVDEARYGLVGIYTWLTGEKRVKQLRAQAQQYNTSNQQLDWYNM